MKKYLFLLPLAFVGCTFTQTSKKVTSFTKCYVHQLPAPFWICYQSSFMSVGKVHTQEISRLKQEEAYAKGVNNLVEKLIIKTKKFLERVEIKKDIIVGELFYQICAEKGIDPDKFNILNTWKNKPAGGFMSNPLLTVCFTGVIIAAILITKDLLNS